MTNETLTPILVVNRRISAVQEKDPFGCCEIKSS